MKKLKRLWKSETSRLIRGIQGGLIGIGSMCLVAVNLPAGQLHPKLLEYCKWGMSAYVIATGLGFTKKKEDPNQLPPK